MSPALSLVPSPAASDNPESDPSLVEGACYQRAALYSLFSCCRTVPWTRGTACGPAGLDAWLLLPCAAHQFLLLPGHGLYCWWDFMHLSQCVLQAEQRRNVTVGQHIPHFLMTITAPSSSLFTSRKFTENICCFPFSFRRTNVKYWTFTVGCLRRHTKINSARVLLLLQKIKQPVNAVMKPL